MRSLKKRIILLFGLLILVNAFSATENVDLNVMMKIREEGFTNSKVMDIAGYLCDVIGPRLTGSPNSKKAHEWTRQQLETWGLVNAHVESWPFGRGWSVEHVSAHLTEPEHSPLIVWPRAWTPGTNGLVKGKVVAAKIGSESDFEKYRGKLAGMILLTEDKRELKPHEQADSKRLTSEQLEEIRKYNIPAGSQPPSNAKEEYLKRIKFQKALRQFYQDEKVLAIIEPAQGDGGILRNLRGPDYYKPEEAFPIPNLFLSAEQYNRLIRLLERKIEPEVELDVRVRFYDGDLLDGNTLAEIPGSDKKEEVVMLGAHLDSWHLGTGATDDGAGCAVAMEAVRILKALGVQPRRTIRIALWGGEEQGLLGSREYVSRHLASFPEPTDPEEKKVPSFFRKQEGPLDLKPDYSKFSVYFNFDEGGGKIRGVYAQDNLPAAGIFENWLKPFSDLGAATVTVNRNDGGTDHLSFDAVGLPGFQFIQDELDYSSRTWHTNMDVYDRLQKEDLMEASVVMAAFVYNAAMRDEPFPRRPLPEKLIPKGTQKGK
ncbi:MAG TPA: M20/M25/M40 family metallo-hydrolase [Acidobacteriota bacterium]|nr:M20/M25/M40 family metallo-hydrolase [Acidobacteriota bacterium]